MPSKLVLGVSVRVREVANIRSHARRPTAVQLRRLQGVEQHAARLQRKLDTVRERQCELLSRTIDKSRKYLVQAVRPRLEQGLRLR